MKFGLAGEKVVVGTDAGELLIVDTSDLKTTIHLPWPEEKATVICSQGKVGLKICNLRHIFPSSCHVVL